MVGSADSWNLLNPLRLDIWLENRKVQEAWASCWESKGASPFSNKISRAERVGQTTYGVNLAVQTQFKGYSEYVRLL